MNGEALAQAYAQAQQENERLRSTLAQAQQDNELLHQELAQAQEVIVQLTARLERLEGQRAKDSHNSSKPPSSDGFKKPVQKTKSLRGKSGKQSGGQHGHAGHTLQMREVPEQVVVVPLRTCSQCQQGLQTQPVVREERAQVWELPAMQVHVTEYRAQVKVCPCCHTETRAAFPAGVKAQAVHYGPMLRAWAVYLHAWHLLPYARTCQLLSDLLGTTFSQASLQAAMQESSQSVEPVLDGIRTGLIRGAILHNDETGLRVAGRRWWVHVACTQQLTWYQAHRNRGPQATDAIGILPQFRGVSIHDSLVSYLQYPCDHALCNAHYLRELTFAEEQHQQAWAKAMKDLLREIKTRVEQARTAGLSHLSSEECEAYELRYERLVSEALAAHPPPQRVAGARGRPPRGDEVRNLLCRLHDYQALILRFMHQFAVPFDNNRAEQDLRMIKVQQKIAGCFRTEEGVTHFCRLRSYLSTLHKQGFHLLTALQHVFLGSPLLPSLGG